MVERRVISLIAGAIAVAVLLAIVTWASLGTIGGGTVTASNAIPGDTCKDLPNHSTLTAVLDNVVAAGGNGGLANDMWGTIVNRDGQVCVVTFSGVNRGSQWPISRVISAQKANTANAVALPDGSIGILPGLALSTANLFSAVQPGGSLFGLQFSNPVDTNVAYGGSSQNYGQPNDPMVGKNVGGVNVFGGGLALYGEDDDGNVVLLGAVGVSGDTSCTDHIIAWKVRDSLGLDFVPVGVSPTGDDNMIFDISVDANGHSNSAGGFGHPDCGFGAKPIAEALPADFPLGPNP